MTLTHIFSEGPSAGNVGREQGRLGGGGGGLRGGGGYCTVRFLGQIFCKQLSQYSIRGLFVLSANPRHNVISFSESILTLDFTWTEFRCSNPR